MIRGAIFDMDGTLLDSMIVWDHISQRYLKQHFDLDVTDEEYAALEGHTQMQYAQYFCERYPQITQTPEALVEGMDQLIDSRYAALAKPRDGVRAFLDGLRAAGVHMAVATLTDRRHAEPVLRDQGLLDYFDFMLTIEDVGVNKFRPDIFLAAAARMGLAPADCMVFEDAPYAAETAARAGFRVCGVCEPAYAAGEEQLRAASEFVVERSFDELNGLLLNAR